MLPIEILEKVEENFSINLCAASVYFGLSANWCEFVDFNRFIVS